MLQQRVLHDWHTESQVSVGKSVVAMKKTLLKYNANSVKHVFS